MRDTIQKQMLAMEPEVQQYKHYRPDDPAIKTKAMLQMIQALQVGEGTSVYLSFFIILFSRGNSVTKAWLKPLPIKFKVSLLAYLSLFSTKIVMYVEKCEFVFCEW